MSAIKYYENISEVLNKIHTTQQDKLQQVGEILATAIAAGKRVFLYGSGHSVIPVMDIFPRYGAYVGFFPLYDPRLMWSNVIGPNGARELLWLERKEGYAEVFLQSFLFEPGDAMIVFSHGGMNAAPIEAAMYAKKKGLTVIAVTSMANYAISKATHSSGKKLADVADITIDNCVAPEDSQVDIGRPEKVGAGSTMAVVFVSMSLVSETATRLLAKGFTPTTFVSPNVPGIAKDHNDQVYAAFTRFYYSRTIK